MPATPVQDRSPAHRCSYGYGYGYVFSGGYRSAG